MKFINTVLSTFMFCLALALFIEYFRVGHFLSFQWTKVIILALGVGFGNAYVQQKRRLKS